jgi:valyl-tRNA synthetase
MIPSALGGTASANDGPFPGRYEHEAIEPKWQKYWEDKKTFKVRVSFF